MRVLQVGAGVWGSSWAQLIAGSGDADLAGVVDPDPDALETTGELARVSPDRRFPTLADALARVEADAAVVAVPPALHVPVAIEALEAGLHCLVEKPFALLLAEAEDAVRRAEDLGRILVVNQDHRHTRGARTVRRLVSEGAVGPVAAVRLRFAREPNLRPFHLGLAEPLLLDMAVHHFDQVRALGFEIDRVWARTFNPPWSPFAGNVAADVLLEANDARTSISYAGTWAPRGRRTSWTGEWELEGPQGAVVWDGDRVEIVSGEEAGVRRRLKRALGRRLPLDPVSREGRSGSLAELAAAVAGGGRPETSGADNLASLAVTLAAVESAGRGEPVDVASARTRAGSAS